MKKSFIVLSIILTIVFTAGTNGVVSEAAGNPHRVIVTLGDPINDNARSSLENLGGKVLKELPLINGLVVLLPSEAIVSDVGALAGVRAVEEDAIVFALAKPNGKPGNGGGGSRC